MAGHEHSMAMGREDLDCSRLGAMAAKEVCVVRTGLGLLNRHDVDIYILITPRVVVFLVMASLARRDLEMVLRD